MTEPEIERALTRMDKLAVDADGWLILYRDPTTGELWELSYPRSESQGGGPRSLGRIEVSEAKTRFPTAPL